MRSVRLHALVLGLIAVMATVCRAQTGACCGIAGTCMVAPQAACPGVYLGKGSTCTPGACDAVTGACCNPNGACTISTRSLCKAVGGSYKGDASSCANVACPQPTGACCDAGGQPCTNLDKDSCLSLGGTFYTGVACTPLGACPLGACCLPQGVCSAGVSQPSCINWQGTFQGVGTTCAGVVCPVPVGACCTSSGACALLNASICSLFGQWSGPGTTCPTACLPPGVCCRGSTCATGITATACTAAEPVGASFFSGQAVCNPAGGLAAPCCLADVNKRDGVDLQDVFDYLNAWFAQNPYARFGGNGTGTPVLQDLFSFLNAWFAGTC